MNLTVSLLLLPSLGLFYKDLLYVLDNLKVHKNWKMTRVKLIDCSNYEMIDKVIRLITTHDIPVTISTSIDNHTEYPAEVMDFILTDELTVDMVRINYTSPRIYLSHSTGTFSPSFRDIYGRVLILLWGTGEVYCRNPLVADGWFEGIVTQCQWGTRRNTNPRRISVFLQEDMSSHVVQNRRGNFILAGFKGLLLSEMKQYLNVRVRYVLPRGFGEKTHSPFRRFQIFIKPLRGVNLGNVNTTLSFSRDEDSV